MAQYLCPNCETIYDESKGNPHEGHAPGTLWKDLPDDFSCIACFVSDKEDFERVEKQARPCE